MSEASGPHLRRGWTTGTCATAAVRAAFEALVTGHFPDPVSVTLPRGGQPAFALAMHDRGEGYARAGVVKDAGDDPDATHGAMVIATVRLMPTGSGIRFKAGKGVGTITRAGLPIPPGEPAINPVPRAMMRQAIEEAAAVLGAPADVEIEISIPDGEELAKRTLNGRLGIVGGLSILGTTGIVVPFSCAAWIATIHRGIDVARAEGLDHIAGATGATSEEAVRKLHDLSEVALIDMGDFVGGMLKYVRSHPVRRVTIAGGFAKMTKLAQGLLDLHSKRGEVDRARLARFVAAAGGDDAMVASVAGANTALEVLERMRAAGLELSAHVADAAWNTAANVLQRDDILLDIAIFDREGGLLAETQAKPAVLRGSPRLDAAPRLWHARAMHNAYVMKLSCGNRPGIVAGVSDFLFRHGYNILESRQFDDTSGGSFFMRVVFNAAEGARPGNLPDEFVEVAQKFSMSWSIRSRRQKRRVMILVSRFDHCLVDLLYRRRIGELPMEITGVIANHTMDVYAHVDLQGIPFHYLPTTKEAKREQEQRILQLIRATDTELVVLARYMQILSEEMTAELASRCINIHHSFLPGFKGARPYHQAHERGVKLIGATAHYVTAALDEGPIIEQDVERITHADSPEDLVRKGRDIERRVLARAVRYHLDDRVILNGAKTVVFAD